jgi:DNA-binding NarL/FixJ family response regulator
LGGILVVDDHPLIAKGCRSVFDSTGFGDVVSAFDLDSGYAAFLRHKPDVAIVDLTLQKEASSGLALISRTRSYDPDAKILVFTMHAASDHLISVIEAGALGYLVKDCPTAELRKAVQQVRSGRRYIDPQLTLKLVFPNAALVPREKQVLALLMAGRPCAAIAAQLGIKRKTVVDLMRRARRKLGDGHVDILIRLVGERSGDASDFG